MKSCTLCRPRHQPLSHQLPADRASSHQAPVVIKVTVSNPRTGSNLLPVTRQGGRWQELTCIWVCFDKENNHVRAANYKNLSLGVEPATFTEKQKSGQLRKPAGGHEPPTNHQGGCKPSLKREISFNWLSLTKADETTRASSQTGPGGLAAPNGSRATSSYTINDLGGSQPTMNDFCWVVQQIQYQLGLLNNLASKSVPVPTSSPENKAPVPIPPSSLKFNITSPTDVMKHHLQEDVSVSPANQINPVREDSCDRGWLNSHSGKTNHQDATQWSTRTAAQREDHKEDTGDN
ncbi:hypothetical protein DSO57_1013760 [Entomophthora muscae]|uniref:Uncharacterized protein n=1 Tax=Entomophthora muscae TaxID=34485 RepID=A0ACC2RK95_9FUNG|nr:hypothetical protein DSO57_1013760 [Entomophthora muscae]